MVEAIGNIPEDSGVSEGLMRQPRDKYCSNFPLAASNNPKYGGEGFSGLKITHNQCLGLNGLEYTFYGISVATYTPRLIMYQYELHTK